MSKLLKVSLHKWLGITKVIPGPSFYIDSHMQSLNNLISDIQNSQKTLFILCGFPYFGKSYIEEQLQLATDVKAFAIDGIFSAQGFDWDTNALTSADKCVTL